MVANQRPKMHHENGNGTRRRRRNRIRKRRNRRNIRRTTRRTTPQIQRTRHRKKTMIRIFRPIQKTAIPIPSLDAQRKRGDENTKSPRNRGNAVLRERNGTKNGRKKRVTRRNGDGPNRRTVWKMMSDRCGPHRLQPRTGNVVERSEHWTDRVNRMDTIPPRNGRHRIITMGITMDLRIRRRGRSTTNRIMW